MSSYEYKVVPAPRAAAKEKGIKGTEARFAATLAKLMNEFGADGWEYQRAERLPCEERKGLTGRVETTQHVLIFRRVREKSASKGPSLGAPSSAVPRGEATPRLVLDQTKSD